jgi:glycerol-3-phosphate dehydrogenase
MLINYMKVESLTKDANGKVCGVRAKDLETGNDYVLNARAVVNATGVFVDNILQMNASSGKAMVRPSQGVHIVLDHSFLLGKNALMIPATSDGRVLFAVPWHNHVLVGTTDTPLEEHSLEPVPLEDEINFVLETLGQYLIKKPTEKDVLSVFAGLRPLAAQNNNNGQTKEISRSHKLFTTPSGLITITGGKWTTYRKMAEDTVNEAIKVARLRKRPCVTSSLRIHGHKMDANNSDHLSIYGSDSEFLRALSNEHEDLRQILHPAFPHTYAEVIWAVRNEMARTVEDILARRLRVLFLNAHAAIEMAPKVAALVAGELGFDREWQRNQVDDFTSLAGNYLLESNHQPKHHLTVL